MFFIFFGKKPMPPQGHGKPHYGILFTKFSGSALAKTYLKKMVEAKRQLVEMDSHPALQNIHPTDQRYQKRLRELYTAKHQNSINYWAAFRNFAKNSGADRSVIKSIEKEIEKENDEWQSIQKFLR